MHPRIISKKGLNKQQQWKNKQQQSKTLKRENLIRRVALLQYLKHPVFNKNCKTYKVIEKLAHIWGEKAVTKNYLYEVYGFVGQKL